MGSVELGWEGRVGLGCVGLCCVGLGSVLGRLGRLVGLCWVGLKREEVRSYILNLSAGELEQQNLNEREGEITGFTENLCPRTGSEPFIKMDKN